MLALAPGKMDGKEFLSHAPGYWSRDGGIPAKLWNDWKWQLKNRVTSLAQLEQQLELSNEERSGVLLSGTKLALAITPHFFNLIERDNPDCPIRRQVIPRIEETWTSPYDMADPCGEDSHMPVPGRLRAIPHIEFLRIGTRVPIFLPQRITPELCAMLKKYHPLWMSVHVNHPRELTIEVKQALERLANAGIPLGNQSVLLAGVNDD